MCAAQSAVMILELTLVTLATKLPPYLLEENEFCELSRDMPQKLIQMIPTTHFNVENVRQLRKNLLQCQDLFGFVSNMV
jgi:hypothetical protein